jgi:hypothetical protein
MSQTRILYQSMRFMHRVGAVSSPDETQMSGLFFVAHPYHDRAGDESFRTLSRGAGALAADVRFSIISKELHVRIHSIAAGLACLFAFTVLTGRAEPALDASSYSSAGTQIGTLLDDPAARAILQKYLPDVVSSQRMDTVRPMTLKVLQEHAGGRVTDAVLAKIDAELAALPPKK